MVSGISASLSGLAAADRRLGAAADNIANQFSTRTKDQNGDTQVKPPPRLEVTQQTQAEGGVRATVQASSRPPVRQFQPENPDADEQGFVATPDVDTAEELVNFKIATYDYKANLKALQIQDEINESTLDILS